jgi:hypothetical protein
MTEKILLLIAVCALVCIPVTFGIWGFVEVRSMAVTELSTDEDQLQPAIEYAFYIANRPARTNGAVARNLSTSPSNVE